MTKKEILKIKKCGKYNTYLGDGVIRNRGWKRFLYKNKHKYLRIIKLGEDSYLPIELCANKLLLSPLENTNGQKKTRRFSGA